MAEAGLIYHTDWLHDDQPVPIRVQTGKLVSVPYSIELNDVPVLATHFEGEYFVQICKAQFDQLYQEGADSGRVMCIALHPYLIGQPHRIRYLDQILRYIMAHDGVCTVEETYAWQTRAAGKRRCQPVRFPSPQPGRAGRPARASFCERSFARAARRSLIQKSSTRMIHRCMTASLTGLERLVHKTYAECKAKGLKFGVIPTKERQLS